MLVAGRYGPSGLQEYCLKSGYSPVWMVIGCGSNAMRTPGSERHVSHALKTLLFHGRQWVHTSANCINCFWRLVEICVKSFLAIVILRFAMLFSMYGSSSFFNILISKWQDHARLDLDLLVDLLLDLPLHAHCHHATFPSISLAPMLLHIVVRAQCHVEQRVSSVLPHETRSNSGIKRVELHGLDVVLSLKDRTLTMTILNFPSH